MRGTLNVKSIDTSMLLGRISGHMSEWKNTGLRLLRLT